MQGGEGEELLHVLLITIYDREKIYITHRKLCLLLINVNNLSLETYLH